MAKLRGSTWESALRTHVIEPLGVSLMALYAEEAVLFRTAAGHLGDEQKLFPRWQLPQSNAPAGATPSAAMRELVRFGRMFLAGGVAEDGTRILPTGTFTAMREPQVTLCSDDVECHVTKLVYHRIFVERKSTGGPRLSQG